MSNPVTTECSAPESAEWATLRTGHYSDAVREAAIARAYLRPEMVVADVGNHGGFMAAGLAPLVRQVHVIDSAPAMLEVARRNLARFANVVFHCADREQLPLADGSVDAVFAYMYLHHCYDPQGAIQELVRILRPGGRLMITDLNAHSYVWLQREMAEVWMGFTRDQLRPWLRAAGLVNVLVRHTG
ncbi:MAG: class I SAM-dependent methyltransferase, partial [Anaerolineae bacterium]|nr:class I SAM-dependent methyltransferase [Anaerolineae bacterium]